MSREGAKKTPNDPAELIYSRTVETELGARYVHLYWGDIASLLRQDRRSIAIVNTQCFQSRRPAAVSGQCWRALTDTLPGLAEQADQHRFKVVIQAGPDSSVWPLSDDLRAEWSRIDSDPNIMAQAILASRHSHTRKDGC